MINSEHYIMILKVYIYHFVDVDVDLDLDVYVDVLLIMIDYVYKTWELNRIKTGNTKIQIRR